MSDVVVTNNPAKNRYEAHRDGALAGIADYVLLDDLIAFTHVEVEPAYEGQGIAAALARTAFDDVRAAGTRRAVPQCPYMKQWIRRHPDYADLVHHAS